MTNDREAAETQVVVLAPRGRDAFVVSRLFSTAGLSTTVCASSDELREELARGAGVVVITQEGLTAAVMAVLEAALDAQPGWSDLPVVLLVTTASGYHPSGDLTRRNNVTVLERPTRAASLVTVVRFGLRARERQYQLRDQFDKSEDDNERLEIAVVERTHEIIRANQLLREEVIAHRQVAAELSVAREQTEAARLRVTTILESITDGFMALDREYRFVYLNPRAEKMFAPSDGGPPADLVGQSVWRVLPRSENGAFFQHFQSALNDRLAGHFEEFHQGMRVWLEVHVYPFEQGVAVYMHDVTVRRRSQEELLEAIRAVMSDAAWFSQALLEKLVQVRGATLKVTGDPDIAEVAHLTVRERQVLERMANGADNAAIATDLKVAEQTVRNHVTNIYMKLGVHSRSDAVIWARERGLVKL